MNKKQPIIWFTGLSGSGKSTLGTALEKVLQDEGRHVRVLDGDDIRTGLCKDLGFSEEDRKENIRRVAEVAKLFSDNGIVTICCFISPTNEIREMAREIIGKNYVEIYVDTPLEVCQERDVKGLYAKAELGEIKNFTGISAPFDIPTNPEVKVATVEKSVEESLHSLRKSLDKYL